MRRRRRDGGNVDVLICLLFLFLLFIEFFFRFLSDSEDHSFAELDEEEWGLTWEEEEEMGRRRGWGEERLLRIDERGERVRGSGSGSGSGGGSGERNIFVQAWDSLTKAGGAGEKKVGEGGFEMRGPASGRWIYKEIGDPNALMREEREREGAKEKEREKEEKEKEKVKAKEKEQAKEKEKEKEEKETKKEEEKEGEHVPGFISPIPVYGKKRHSRTFSVPSISCLSEEILQEIERNKEEQRRNEEEGEEGDNEEEKEDTEDEEEEEGGGKKKKKYPFMRSTSLSLPHLPKGEFEEEGMEEREIEREHEREIEREKQKVRRERGRGFDWRSILPWGREERREEGGDEGEIPKWVFADEAFDRLLAHGHEDSSFFHSVLH